ncbi:hypothetical protein OROGR_018445 [Orobanche gracilis]
MNTVSFEFPSSPDERERRGSESRILGYKNPFVWESFKADQRAKRTAKKAVDAPPRRGGPIKLDLEGNDHVDIPELRECASLALKAHALRNPHYSSRGLRLIKIVEATISLVSGLHYAIIFEASNDSRVVATFEAHVLVTQARREVLRVRALSPSEGKYPLWIVCLDILCRISPDAFSGTTFDVELGRRRSERLKMSAELLNKDRETSSHGESLKADSQPAKKRAKKSGKKDVAGDAKIKPLAKYKECTILALQHYTLYDRKYYSRGLHIIKIINVNATTLVDGFTCSIIFEASNDSKGKVTLEADVRDNSVKREVIRVRALSPSKGKWLTGKLCFPKFSVKLE